MNVPPPYPADGIVEIAGRGFDFGSLQFDDGQRLSPKAAHVLWLLVQAAGRTVEKDQLLDLAWAGQPRVPDVLVQAVGDIRRGLGDADRRGLVLTVPKIGYRLQAEVRWRERSDAAPAAGTAAASVAAAPPTPPPAWPRGVWLALATVMLALAALAALRLGERAPPAAGTAVEQPVQRPWRMDAVRRLTHEPGPDLMPQLSPDGDELLYVRRLDGRYGLWRRRLDGSPPQRLAAAADSDDLYPAWDAEGRRIAFLRYTDGACAVMLLEDPAAAPRGVGGCFADFFAPLAFSADGGGLLLTDRVASAQPLLHLVRLDLASGRLEMPDYSRDPQRTDSDARLAPDARRLAFRRSGAASTLHLVELDSGATRPLHAFAAGLAGFDWLPDGSGLLVSTAVDGRPGLYLLDLDGGLRFLTEGHYARLTRAPRGERWAAVAGETRSGLWRHADGRDAPLLPAGAGRDRHPTALPDGGLLFVSDRGGQPALWRLDAGAEAPRQWSREAAGALGAPLLRADGEVWAPLLRDGRWQLARWRADGSPAPPLRADGDDLLELADDGQRLWAIAARAGQPGSSELVELQVEDAALRLRRTGIEAIAVRAGDGRLYVRQHLRRGIRAVDPVTLALGDPLGERHFIDWQLDGDGVLHWIADDALRHSLWRTALAGGAAQRVLQGHDDVAAGAGITRLADGSLVLVRQDFDALDIIGFRLHRE